MFEKNRLLGRVRLNRLAFILTAVYLFASGAIPRAYAERPRQAIVLTELARFLNTIPVIRVPITSAPGLGHQSAGATVVSRLRQLGYVGHIEVVYDGEGVAEKLGYLFPPFDSKKSVPQNFPEQNLSILPVSALFKRPQNIAVLGIKGADDQRVSADDVNVNVLLSLSPFQWENGSNRIGMNTRFNNFGSAVEVEMRQLDQLGYVFPPPSPTDVSEFIRKQMSHDPVLNQKIAGLSAALNPKMNPHEVMPVYGHSVDGPIQLVKVVSALSLAQLVSPTTFSGGVVVPVFSNVSQQMRNIIQGNFRPNERTSFIDVTDADAVEKIQSVKPGEVIVVYVGRVTKEVFEYAYAHSSLPPMVEGKNSINFMQLVGKPYFPSSTHESYHFKNAPELEKISIGENLAILLANEAARGLLPNDARVDATARFIIQSKVPNSAMQSIFKRFSVNPSENLMKDKLVRGLLLVRKIIPRWQAEWQADLRSLELTECEKLLRQDPPVL